MRVCMAAISVKFQSGFVEITFLHVCSPAGLHYVCRKSFLENTSGGLLLNTDNFMYTFYFILCKKL